MIDLDLDFVYLFQLYDALVVFLTMSILVLDIRISCGYIFRIGHLKCHFTKWLRTTKYIFENQRSGIEFHYLYMHLN